MSNLLYSKFLQNVKQYPNNIAVVNGSMCLTYRDIAARSINLAAWLRQYALPNTLVAIYMDKGWEQIIAALGIILSGSAYLPISTDVSESQLDQILSIGEAKVIVTQACYLDDLNTFGSQYTICCIDNVAAMEVENFIPCNRDDDLAYVIFTSGSTGEPKGVAIQHKAVVNTINVINERFNVSAQDSILAVSELNFDLSVYDIFGLLSVGGKIVIPLHNEKKSPTCWDKLLIDESITIWNSVPASLQMLIEEEANRIPKTLRLALLSGDWVSVNLVNKLRLTSPHIMLVSLGGATEASIWSVAYEIDMHEPLQNNIPYGKALAGQIIEVLSEDLNMCKVGEIGEIYIGGEGLAKNYWNNEAQTKKSFIWDIRRQQRLYKTGDLGKYLEDMNIEFIGRKDFQVKINGYRIELEAIQAEINKCLGVIDTVVVAKGEAIYAYITVTDQGMQDVDVLQRLKQRLKPYMLPKKIIVIDKFPITHNGKVNRKYLVDNLFHYLRIGNSSVKPRSKYEFELLKIWQLIFQYENIGMEDDFFLLGGGSLLAVKLVAIINETWGLNLSSAIIFECSTIVKLSKKIQNYLQPSAVVQLSNKKDGAVFLIHPISGKVFCYQLLTSMLQDKVTVYAIELPSHLIQSGVTLEKLATEYVRQIKLFVDPPYTLIGWSLGGLIAFEMAHQLGDKYVNKLCLLDTLAPLDINNSIKIIQQKTNLSSDVLNYFIWEISKLVGEIDLRAKALSKLNIIYAITHIANYIKRVHKNIVASNLVLFDQYVNAFKYLSQALLDYKGANKIVNNIHFFYSSETVPQCINDWQRLSRSVINKYDVSGTHLDMLAHPNVLGIANKLLEFL